MSSPNPQIPENEKAEFEQWKDNTGQGGYMECLALLFADSGGKTSPIVEKLGGSATPKRVWKWWLTRQNELRNEATKALAKSQRPYR